MAEIVNGAGKYSTRTAPESNVGLSVHQYDSVAERARGSYEPLNRAIEAGRKLSEINIWAGPDVRINFPTSHPDQIDQTAQEPEKPRPSIW